MTHRLDKILLYGLLSLSPLALGHAGQHEQLIRLDQAIEQQPNEQALYIKRGATLSHGGHYQQALADYARAQQLGDPVVVAYDLGVTYYRMQQYDKARHYLDEYLGQYPYSAAAYDYRSRVARAMGDKVQASADLRRYFQLQDSPHPGNYISAAELLEAQGETAEALATLDQGMAKLGLTPQLQRRAIALERRRQQPAAAIARMETLRVPLGESPHWKVEMAELLLEDNRPREAKALLLEAQTELRSLRPTPARLALQQRVSLLLGGDGSPDS